MRELNCLKEKIGTYVKEVQLMKTKLIFESLLNKIKQIKNKNPKSVIRCLFWPLEIVTLVFLIGITYYAFYWDYDYSILESLGETFGVISVAFFSIAILPGMLIRLGFRNDWTRLLMIYRREFGKLMFILHLDTT